MAKRGQTGHRVFANQLQGGKPLELGTATPTTAGSGLPNGNSWSGHVRGARTTSYLLVIALLFVILGLGASYMRLGVDLITAGWVDIDESSTSQIQNLATNKDVKLDNLQAPERLRVPKTIPKGGEDVGSDSDSAEVGAEHHPQKEDGDHNQQQQDGDDDDQNENSTGDEQISTPAQDVEKELQDEKSLHQSPEAQQQESEEEEEFDAPLDIRPVNRNGCPFGWHSPSEHSPNCYHVSLVPLVSDDANGRCAELGSVVGIRAYLARIPSTEVNLLLCDVLNRGNNRFFSPDRLHIGLAKGDSSAQGLSWRDGKEFTSNGFAPFLTSTALSASTSGNTVTLICSAKSYLKWNVEADSILPFACSGPKIKLKASTEAPENMAELNDDSFTYERSSDETPQWHPVAPFEKHTLDACPKLKEMDEDGLISHRQHKNPILSRLETQISWKLTDRRSRLDPKRYYMVWQSKSWFGWLDFWVEYLQKYRDFHGAPVGKYVTSSRAAKERLGYSSIFANPATAQKYEGALVVLSRLPIPDNVLAYFPPGTLVNQIYMDPLARVPLGDKLELAQYLTRYAKHELKCSEVADLEVIPRTFDLSTEDGCKDAIKVMESQENKEEIIWVVKGPKHGGAAINLFSSEQAIARLGTCSSTVLDRHELVQRLVTNPLLLDGRKFDLRVFVLVASTKPLIVYIHREPYYRATIRKFQTSTSAGNEKSRHVTNTHIQKVARYNFTDKDWADHLWTPEKIRSYTSKANVRSDFWDAVVFPKIKRAVQTVLRATASSITDRRAGQWKLFGVDFVIDENLNPLLLDWNAFPGWDWSYRLAWTLDYRRRILGDTWRLMLDVQRGKAIAESRDTPKSGGFELVYHTLQ